MQSPQSQEIVVRFFRALQYLIDSGEIKSRNWYCTEYGIVQHYFWKTENNPSSKIFDIGWMTPLISDYGISAHWLMTGSGSMLFKSPPDTSRKLMPIADVKNAK